ncbi:L,D-transpeptidase [Candidatus Daviesbacteria bacterium]|nr:L,D-transpeptidase [Candidatus Daviesbacteria bacterium]
MHRLLPLLLIISLVFLVILNFQSIRRDLAYKFNFSGDPTVSCCNEADVTKVSGEFDENETTAIFNSQIIDYPKTSLAYSIKTPQNTLDAEEQAVLGTTNAAGEEKWIEVSIPEQRLRAWEGSRIVMEFPISSGKWAPTPIGDFAVWYKTRSQKMEGGSKELGTYYYLPNVPHNMFFHKGYAIHGAYWHNNFGTPMSHGCVNSPLNYVAQLFDWTGPVVPEGENVARATEANPGTRVYIH